MIATKRCRDFLCLLLLPLLALISPHNDSAVAVQNTVTPRYIALTFDDGPVPEVTPWVLDTLDHYGVKATFFCVGDNGLIFCVRSVEEAYEGSVTKKASENGWTQEVQFQLLNCHAAQELQ